MCDPSEGSSCSCCSTPAATDTSTTESTNADVTTTSYVVTGMTCGHCVSSVSTEVGRLAGVTDVQVDLPTGKVTVSSDTPLQLADIRAAVDEAGYELVG